MVKTISRILFATDMSRNSTYALRHVVGLASSLDAQIHILHVCEPLSEDAKVTLQLFMQDAKARSVALSKRIDVARNTLAEREAKFWQSMPEEQQGLRKYIASMDVLEGYAPDVILARAKAKRCDLIVLGTHAHGLRQTFLGSVAKRVLRRADVLTLVVPYQADKHADKHAE